MVEYSAYGARQRGLPKQHEGDRLLQALVEQQVAVCVRLCIYLHVVQWDNEKAASNVKKHGVDFADAVVVLSDEMA